MPIFELKTYVETKRWIGGKIMGFGRYLYNRPSPVKTRDIGWVGGIAVPANNEVDLQGFPKSHCREHASSFLRGIACVETYFRQSD